MTKEEIEKHKIAAKKLDLIKNKAFKFIKKKLGEVSEYDVSQFILSEFKKQGLIADKKWPIQIIATNDNSSIVHYYPKKDGSKIIKKDNLILIDIWAKLNQENSPFADITWIGYSGKIIPRQIQKTFQKVIMARETALEFIRKELKNKNLLKTQKLDKKVRDCFKEFNLDKYFLHGTGHSLGFSNCHGKYFCFGKKSKTQLRSNIPFTIEPGIYFKNKFGIRSEIDCYVTEDYKLIITTKIQDKIIKI